MKVQPQEEPGDDETIDKEKPEVETSRASANAYDPHFMPPFLAAAFCSDEIF